MRGVKWFGALCLMMVALVLGGCDSETTGNAPADGGGGTLDTGVAQDIGGTQDTGGAQDTGGTQDTGGAQDTGTTPCPKALAAVGNKTRAVNAGAKTVISVRLSDCKGALSGRSVTFTIQGTAAGASLSANQASTNATGDASVTLTAGLTAATFKVKAALSATVAVLFDITVKASPFGAVVAKMSYKGSKTFNQFVAHLWQNKPCSTLDPFGLPTALKSATPVALITGQPKFTSVPTGQGYSVGVTAHGGGKILGFGCVDQLTVSSAKTTTALVPIKNLPVVYSGTYNLDNKFNLTGVLPPSVANTLSMLYEASDDNDLNNESNNNGTGEYGVDPAAFLLDFVFREICAWECKSGEKFSNCSEINHPKGDLKALYHNNFTKWSGAQPRGFGLCGVLDWPTSSGYVHYTLQSQLQAMIKANASAKVLNFLQIASDLSSAFTNMRIKSILTLNNVADDRVGNYTHELKKMVIDVHDLNGKVHVKEFDLSAAGLTNLSYTGNTTALNDVLQIPVHSFKLQFGMILEYIYLKFVLPTLGYTSTAQMFQTFVNCQSVGTWIYNQVISYVTISPYSAKDFEKYCGQALQAAGTWIEGEIHKLVKDSSTFSLQGTCEAGNPLGPKRLATTLVGGKWQGKITDNASTKTFTGTFTGKRK